MPILDFLRVSVGGADTARDAAILPPLTRRSGFKAKGMNAPYLRYGRRVWTSLENVVAGGHPVDDVFSDWINLMLDAYLSITDNFARKGRSDPKNLDGQYEDRYAWTAAKYHRKEMLALVQAYLDIAVGVEKHGGDTLGEIYDKCIRAGHRRYFTRKTAAEHVALLSLRPGMRVHDPRCGSGTMLIEAGKVADVELLGEDTDPVCARMCALNLVLFHFLGHIREGDSVKCVREWRIAKGHISEHGMADNEAYRGAGLHAAGSNLAHDVVRR